MTDAFEPALAAAQKHMMAGQYDDAARLLREVVASAPTHAEALTGLGYIAARQGDHQRAADYFVEAAALVNLALDELLFAAQVCQSAQRHDDAIALFERCLAQMQSHPQSLHGLAMSLVARGDMQRALATFDELCKSHPQLAEGHYNRGLLLGKMERYEDELNAYRQAIALQPRFVRAYVNLGVALRDLWRFDEAMLQFKKALALDPNDAGARTNRAQTNLLRGEFEHGWREYEWRWRDSGAVPHGFAQDMLWSGAQPIAGKTILVHHEQGFGDTLQFVRFVDRLTAKEARVVLRVQDALLPLLKAHPGAAQVIGESEPVPPFDYHIPTLSLPFALKLREADFAMSAPYLRADDAALRRWEDLFAGPADRLRVGIAWSGSRTHVNDRNRSIALERLKPLFDADATFISLQQDVRDGDRACFTELVERGMLRDVAARLGSFADTAALIARVDLVISVDTAVAHLAGALGKRIWIALPQMPDWRWQLGRADSPWYPSARLFRQTTRGDWGGVVDALRAELDATRAD